ncbi:MAG: hypothetical protein J0H91_17930 [Rhodospirillales bacterium]|nr:hypothetical protein [Rhodospirillales bacterium]
MTGGAGALCAAAIAVVLMSAGPSPDPDLISGINAYNAGHYAAAFALLGATA